MIDAREETYTLLVTRTKKFRGASGIIHLRLPQEINYSVSSLHDDPYSDHAKHGTEGCPRTFDTTIQNYCEPHA